MSAAAADAPAVFDTIASLTKTAKQKRNKKAALPSEAVASPTPSANEGEKEPHKPPRSHTSAFRSTLKELSTMLEELDIPAIDVVYIERMMAVSKVEFKRRRRLLLAELEAGAAATGEESPVGSGKPTMGSSANANKGVVADGLGKPQKEKKRVSILVHPSEKTSPQQQQQQQQQQQHLQTKGAEGTAALNMSALQDSRHADYYLPDRPPSQPRSSGGNAKGRAREDAAPTTAVEGDRGEDAEMMEELPPPSPMISTQKPSATSRQGADAPAPLSSPTVADDASAKEELDRQLAARTEDIMAQMRALKAALVDYRRALGAVQRAVERRETVCAALRLFLEVIAGELGLDEEEEGEGEGESEKAGLALLEDEVGRTTALLPQQPAAPSGLRQIDLGKVRRAHSAAEGEGRRATPSTAREVPTAGVRRSSTPVTSRPHSSSHVQIGKLMGLSLAVRPVPRAVYAPCLYHYLYYLQLTSLAVVEAVGAWRDLLHLPHPYIMGGRQCLLEMLRELQRLANSAAVRGVLGPSTVAAAAAGPRVPADGEGAGGARRRARSQPDPRGAAGIALRKSSLPSQGSAAAPYAHEVDWLLHPLFSGFAVALHQYADPPAFLANLIRPDGVPTTGSASRRQEVSKEDRELLRLPPKILKLRDARGLTIGSTNKVSTKRLLKAEAVLRDEVQSQVRFYMESLQYGLKGLYPLYLRHLPPPVESQREGSSAAARAGSAERVIRSVTYIPMTDTHLTLSWLSLLERRFLLLKEGKTEL